MNDEQLVTSSPAENIEKVALSPVTWINPGSDSVKAPNCGHPNVDASSHEASNAERCEMKSSMGQGENEKDA